MNKPNVTIENIEMKVIYIRFKGTYVAFRKESKKMFKELFDFAKNNDLIVEGKTKVLTIYHDNHFITDQKNLKMSVAMTIPKSAKVTEEGRICSMEFAGKYGVLHYDIKLNEYEKAWEYAYQDWLFKDSKEKPRDNFPFELYVTEPPRNLKNTSLTDIYIPIE
ncbi:AraC family transcriptional regulator [Miniphocaeibacter massiliensis]|uniref:AraC family transcriptional regulator n=1 Tax=Miniphocaeibacter massiliensis TaxID=2041841 RepID=UPI000C069706|nr:GyrI-like domain-containing protein [Miniphocaeibacter massiliensis]